MASNADRFLAAYNRIEHSLELILQQDAGVTVRHRSFPETVSRAAQINAAVRQHQHDLREYGELRNAIVHGYTEPEVIIATPHDEVVALIERISEQIAAPEKVLPRFAKRVAHMYDTATLKEALDLISSMGFTQIPLFTPDKQFRGLLTESGIASWLSRNYGQKPSGQLADTPLYEVIRFEEPKYNHRFISPDADIYEVRDIFSANERRDRQKVKAIMITASGLPQLPLLGIITPWDVVPLYN